MFPLQFNCEQQKADRSFADLLFIVSVHYCPGPATVPGTEEEELFPPPDGPPEEMFPVPGLVGTVDVPPGWLAAVVGVVLLPG